jgi:hypothetical protein
MAALGVLIVVDNLLFLEAGPGVWPRTTAMADRPSS